MPSCTLPMLGRLQHTGQALHHRSSVGLRCGRSATPPVNDGRPPQRRPTFAAAAASEGPDEQGLEHAEEEAQPTAEQEQRLRIQYQRGNCYGCGVQLQTGDQQVAGFVEPERYEVKRKHRQLGQLLCHRCQELSNGAMIPGVADFVQQREQQQQQQQQARAGEVRHLQGQQPGQQAPGQQQGQQQGQQRRARTGFTDKVLLTPDELREKLKVVQQQRAVVVLLVDLLDVSGSLLGKVRELVGRNPIIMVGTKADLLPAGTDLAAVAEWLQAAATYKRINAVSVHLVSSRTGGGVPPAVAAIRRERRGRDVYVVGAANVGKSAFIRALVRDMSAHGSRQFDAMAKSRGRYLPVESAMPGTTLELIPMEVFASGGMLYDTPGLHLHHRVPHLLTPAENKQLHPRRRLRAYVPPSPAELLEVTTAACTMPAATALAAASGGPVANERSCAVATYWWGGLVKLQVLSCPPDTELVFYGPQALLVEASVELADPPTTAAAAEAAAGSGAEGDSGSGSSASSAAGPGRAQSRSAPGASGGTAAGGKLDEGSEGEEPHGFGAASVMRRGGLRPAKTLALWCAGGSSRQPLADIAVSGIPGWVAVHTSGGRSDTVHVRVWTPPGVEVFNRPPLPVASPLSMDGPGLSAASAANLTAATMQVAAEEGAEEGAEEAKAQGSAASLPAAGNGAPDDGAAAASNNDQDAPQVQRQGVEDWW